MSAPVTNDGNSPAINRRPHTYTANGHSVEHLLSSSHCSRTARVAGWIATAIFAAAFVVGLLGTLGILAIRVPNLAPILAGAGGVAFLGSVSYMIADAVRGAKHHRALPAVPDES